MLKEGVRLDRVRGGRQKYRRMMSAAASATAEGSAHGGGGGGGGQRGAGPGGATGGGVHYSVPGSGGGQVQKKLSIQGKLSLVQDQIKSKWMAAESVRYCCCCQSVVPGLNYRRVNSVLYVGKVVISRSPVSRLGLKKSRLYSSSKSSSLGTAMTSKIGKPIVCRDWPAAAGRLAGWLAATSVGDERARYLFFLLPFLPPRIRALFRPFHSFLTSCFVRC
jgi:hypothetical protein